MQSFRRQYPRKRGSKQSGSIGKKRKHSLVDPIQLCRLRFCPFVMMGSFMLFECYPSFSTSFRRHHFQWLQFHEQGGVLRDLGSLDCFKNCNVSLCRFRKFVP